MRATARDSRPRHWHGKASIAILVALCAFAAGVQVLAPASAGAMSSEITNCKRGTQQSDIPGLGWNGSDYCILEGSGIEVVQVDEQGCYHCLPTQIGSAGVRSGESTGASPADGQGSRGFGRTGGPTSAAAKMRQCRIIQGALITANVQAVVNYMWEKWKASKGMSNPGWFVPKDRFERKIEPVSKLIGAFNDKGCRDVGVGAKWPDPPKA